MKKFLLGLLKFIKRLGIGVLILVAVIASLDALWVFVPQWKASKKIDDVSNYAVSLENINVRDDAKIIAIGEATHGNSDFQLIKLEVLKQMVEKNGARSFALEVDFGDGLYVNDYIHGGQGTAKDATDCLTFNIYHTKEVTEMIQWMRDYNDSVSEDEQLSFYGFDMQIPEHSLMYIEKFCKENDIDTGDALKENIEAVHNELVSKEEELVEKNNYKLVVRATETVMQANEYYDSFDSIDESYVETNTMRDAFMAENVRWLSDYEKSLGNDVMVISGHNGHVQKKAQFYPSMGQHLSEELGDEYFVISTDYYHTLDNINESGESKARGDHHFCSADPLAKQAKYLGSYYLNFEDIAAESDTYDLVNNKMSMGSLGEGYSAVMNFLPTNHRVNMVPSEIGDAMIFVYEATPISVYED